MTMWVASKLTERLFSSSQFFPPLTDFSSSQFFPPLTEESLRTTPMAATMVLPSSTPPEEFLGDGVTQSIKAVQLDRQPAPPWWCCLNFRLALILTYFNS